MSSEWELDEGIKSIKSAWRREHTARANLEKMFEQAEAENAELRERVKGFLGQRDERLAAAETRCNELMDLVRGLMDCPVDLYNCETCEHAEVTPKSVTGNWDKYECRLKARARELGVI